MSRALIIVGRAMLAVSYSSFVTYPVDMGIVLLCDIWYVVCILCIYIYMMGIYYEREERDERYGLEDNHIKLKGRAMDILSHFVYTLE